MGRKRNDLTGQVFNRLTVIEYAGIKNGKASWICKCICDNTVVVRGAHLRNGNTKSCGCYQREIITAISKTRWDGHIKVDRSYTPTGRPVGRPSVAQEVREEVASLVAAGTPYRQIAKILPVTIGLITKISKEYGVTPVTKRSNNHALQGP